MKRVLPFIILVCAIGLSSSAAFYSILGLSMLFAGVRVPVMIMGGFLEASKIVAATLLHNYWSEINRALRIYLVTALVVLSLITSAGIYGLLSQGYQSSANELQTVEVQTQSLELRRERFSEMLTDYESEKASLDKSISDLRSGISTGTINQYKDKETGQIITTSSSGARKVFEQQLNSAIKQRDELSAKMSSVNDSITVLDLKILDINTSDKLAAEIGPLKYLSELLQRPTNVVINWFIVLIIFVFDPLAISLVIAASFAFGRNRNTVVPKPIIEEPKIVIEQQEPITIETVVMPEPEKPKEEPKKQTKQPQAGPTAGPYL